MSRSGGIVLGVVVPCFILGGVLTYDTRSTPMLRCPYCRGHVAKRSTRCYRCRKDYERPVMVLPACE